MNSSDIVQKLAVRLGSWPVEHRNNLRRYMEAGEPVSLGPGCNDYYISLNDGSPCPATIAVTRDVTQTKELVKALEEFNRINPDSNWPIFDNEEHNELILKARYLIFVCGIFDDRYRDLIEDATVDDLMAAVTLEAEKRTTNEQLDTNMSMEEWIGINTFKETAKEL